MGEVWSSRGEFPVLWDLPVVAVGYLPLAPPSLLPRGFSTCRIKREVGAAVLAASAMGGDAWQRGAHSTSLASRDQHVVSFCQSMNTRVAIQ